MKITELLRHLALLLLAILSYIAKLEIDRIEKIEQQNAQIELKLVRIETLLSDKNGKSIN